MLKALKNLFNPGPVYIQVRSDKLLLKDFATRNEFAMAAVMAITNEKPQSVAAYGEEAINLAKKDPSLEIARPFEHPRTILHDFNKAEAMLKFCIRKLFENSHSLFRPSPSVIMHPLEKLDGGLTTVEVRALRELAVGAGARQTCVWSGHVLTAEEVLHSDLLKKCLEGSK